MELLRSFFGKTGVLFVLLLCGTMFVKSQDFKSFRVLVVAATDHYHKPMGMAARLFFEKIASENNFELDFTTDSTAINEDNLSRYQVFIQLHLAPFTISPQQQFAIQQFISKGKGWIGIHAAGLAGKQFVHEPKPYWQWYEDLLGTSYNSHPRLQNGTLLITDHDHPVTRHLPDSFVIRDEWYAFDRPPGPEMHVLARADEQSYSPAKTMGYHPLIWTNPKYDHALYIGIGHDTSICSNENFAILMRDAILWASTPIKNKEQHEMDLSLSQPITVLCNQVAFDAQSPKSAVIRSQTRLPDSSAFKLVDALSLKPVFSGRIKKSGQVKEWESDVWFNEADFSDFKTPGYYYIEIEWQGKKYDSYAFRMEENGLTKTTLPAIANFFYHQRAGSPEEKEADKHIVLYGSNKTVDLSGGWCDASGDVSKYFSHLAYTNYMSPQQIPMVDWSLINTVERLPNLLAITGTKNSFTQEALYGADYIMRSLSPEGYFYMTVFSYFNKDPNARRVVGLLADSKTTSDYQCAWREGGGMAIAALARISKWNSNGAFRSGQYLAAAEKAFAHLQKFSLKYADDGKDNIIDDYCALLASTELWISTGKKIYQTEARKRALNLGHRLSPQGYFISNDSDRPFWHASDAGLPVIALARYLDIEKDSTLRSRTKKFIKKALDYNLSITREGSNPFGYPRQSFLYKGKVKTGFFIPHENESGWWWQGEDARLGSLAAAMIVGGRLIYPSEKDPFGVKPELAVYSSNLISWILGMNPYNICMMYGYGHNNVPYMASLYGHGSGRGGISNGITGKSGNGDGSGIDFKMEDNGNEWRWSEQWIPHSGGFLQAATAMASPAQANIENPRFKALILTERGGIHEGFVVAAMDWLNGFAREHNFEFDVFNRADSLNEEILSHYKLFIQLNYPPYMWSKESEAAFIKYIEEGRGGWIGFHHASLLGEFDGYSMWDWYSQFMGGIRFKNYIAARARGTVHVEDGLHPVMKNLPDSFSLPDDEWYVFDKDPRPQVHVLANVDENSYQPASEIKMGDHPVIWSNPRVKAKNVYFLMGHHANLFQTTEFRIMFANAILWASSP